MNPKRELFATSEYYSGGGQVREAVGGTDIEISASLTVTMRVSITKDVFSPGNSALRDVYQPRGRCVAVLDAVVDRHYGAALRAYFSYHGIELIAMVCPAAEPDKTLRTAEAILEFLGVNNCNVARDEPILVVGGGVISDTAGLAAALLHRRTPYVMLATSVVAAVDAGPSPRTCVNGDQFKNSIGAYHPPVLTLVDSGLFATLESRHIRHGMAEIVKMAAVDELRLFELLEEHGERLLATKFGSVGHDEELRKVGDEVLHRSLLSYLRHEGTNAFEIYQDRPHAYGHTWSPGFERHAGLLHGHAVAIDMALSTTLAELVGWLPGPDRERILALSRRLGLAVYDPILESSEILLAGQEAMRSKRGGRALWAPVPRGQVGAVGYLEEVPAELLAEAVRRNRLHAEGLPGGGRGVDAFLDAKPIH
ncbi:3-dehydroquinate synthase family protein [Kitasatospora acidiphila]|uniref:3-dehydroquinate synthase family protein n=1 Tax=Kitasatospora acidiphila TaxID=2567942 RepID=UPI003C761786